MATLLEYFNHDFNGIKGLSFDATWEVGCEIKNTDTGENFKIEVPVQQRIYVGNDTSARLFTFYVPETPYTLHVCKILLMDLEKLKKQANSMEVIGGFTGDITLGKHKSIYSKRIFIYTETFLNETCLKELEKEATALDLFITMRSDNYLKSKIELEKPMAFISHDSKDKALIAKPIAKGLSSRLCTVWYDEYSLKVGDSLRESIEKGIKEAKKCVLVITPNFLSNSGWSKKEFSSIFTREVLFQENIILPIWYNVEKKEVYEYSPDLADKYALLWPEQNKLGDTEYKQEVELIISKLHTEIKEAATNSNKTQNP